MAPESCFATARETSVRLAMITHAGLVVISLYDPKRAPPYSSNP